VNLTLCGGHDLRAGHSRYSRNRINQLHLEVAMPEYREYRHQPADSRRRGLPAIGFALVAPERIELIQSEPIAPTRSTLLVARERDGAAVIGELEIGVFSAALIMDRDGILEQMVEVEAERAIAAPAAGRRESILPLELETGVAGFRAEVVILRDARGVVKPPFAYVSCCALASSEIIDAGLFVTIRSVRPEWPAGEAMLQSLRIVRMGGSFHARTAGDEMPRLPLVGRRRS
jgi:hypothetical protein